MQHLTVSVADILGRPGEYRDFDVATPLHGVQTALARLTDQPVAGHLRAEAVVEGVLVPGSVRGGTVLTCARCLSELQASVSVEVCELFVGRGQGKAEADAYSLSGAEMALEPMLLDAVTLALPLHPLCRPGCKGLCASCGRDLNAATCDCIDDDIDPRWAALSKLKESLDT